MEISRQHREEGGHRWGNGKSESTTHDRRAQGIQHIVEPPLADKAQRFIGERDTAHDEKQRDHRGSGIEESDDGQLDKRPVVITASPSAVEFQEPKY